MSEENWTKYITGAQQIRGIFGEIPPELTGLRLRRIILRDSGAVDLYIDFRSMPPQVPKRWIAKGISTLQLNLHMVGTMDVAVESPLKWSDCSVGIKEGKITITGKTGLCLFSASYSELYAEFISSAAAQTTREASESPSIEDL